jgi:hypothetical protein
MGNGQCQNLRDEVVTVPKDGAMKGLSLAIAVLGHEGWQESQCIPRRGV